MGIKFYCPNGHKLNVKAFLAGKRGICPHCGCKMDIPLESQRGRGAKNKPSTDAAESMPMVTTANSPAESPGVATATVAVASAPDASAPDASAPDASAPVASAPAASAPAASAPVASAPAASEPVSQAAVTATVAAAPSDPLADAPDAPDALWYVRPTTGGQYGPASPEAMRGWIGEGRVNGQSLVWREGWPEWKKADGIFKQLAQPAGPTTPPVAAAPAMSVPSVASATVPSRPATPPAPTVAPTSTPSVSQANEPQSIARRRKSNIPTIVAVVVMTLLLVVSVVVLVLVMQD